MSDLTFPHVYRNQNFKPIYCEFSLDHTNLFKKSKNFPAKSIFDSRGPIFNFSNVFRNLNFEPVPGHFTDTHSEPEIELYLKIISHLKRRKSNFAITQPKFDRSLCPNCFLNFWVLLKNICVQKYRLNHNSATNIFICLKK